MQSTRNISAKLPLLKALAVFELNFARLIPTAAALALLGPGDYLVDASLFGRVVGNSCPERR